MLRWVVRPPKKSDAAELATIATAVSQPHGHVNPSQLAWSMRQTDGRFWTITQEDQLIGYATLLPLPGLPNLFELAGGIAPPFQRQGAGSFLWHTMQHDLAKMATSAGSGQAVQHITYTVNSLDTPTARFLLHHQFAQEHEEQTMVLNELDNITLPSPDTPFHLQRIGRQTAVTSLPDLYERCFSGTPWFQPYSAAEISATWQPDDQLYYLGEANEDIGFVWLHFPKAGVAEIEPIGIVQQKQGMGYGRTLLLAALNQLQSQDIQTVTLGVWASNLAAIGLYQSVGFQSRSSSYSLAFTFNSK
jgi:ribosomal protein S18 acetylase RimI-like enzyme